ncbi:MFS transporter [Sphingobacterium corticis]|uniref:MFS transporter n=1 Tax=Sphingobacterium corticis TaxID=1812823 RepID=A0ABW5NJ22_9SPHI
MKNQPWLKTYLFIWVGQFFSMVTSYAVHFAVIIWLSLEQQSAEVLALAGIAGMLPQAIIGPFAGVFIDRWDRKKVMMFSDGFIAICAFAMTFLLREEQPDLHWVYALLACRSVGNAFQSPAMQAIAPLIVPEKDLLRVSGINQMLQSVSTIAGPALGTLAITYFAIADVLYLDIVGAIAAITSLLFIRIPHLKIETNSSIRNVLVELKEGFGAIHNNRGLGFLFVYAMLATLFVMPAAIMFPLLTTGHYGGGKLEMSIVEIVWGVGMLIGGSAIGFLGIKTRKVILANAMHIALGIAFVCCGAFPPSWFMAFVIITALSGMACSIFSATFMTTIQEEVDPKMLGRVFSLYFSMAILPSVVGLLFTGTIAEQVGVAKAFIIAGSLVTFVGVISFFTPTLMQLGKKANQSIS